MSLLDRRVGRRPTLSGCTTLRVNPAVEIRDLTLVQPMRVREVADEVERARLWKLAVAAFPPYLSYGEGRG